MVAPVETHIFFLTESLRQLHEAAFLERTSLGGTSVTTAVARGPIGPAVQLARQQVAGAPLGFVTATAGEALEAIAAGADDAQCLPAGSGGECTPTLVGFLDRVALRARLRRETERQSQDLAQAEKLTALGTLVAGVGHELNNPLSMITLGVDFLRDALLPDLEALWRLRRRIQKGQTITERELVSGLECLSSSDTEVRDLLSDISEATDSVAQLVGDLRVFSRNTIVETPSLFSPRAILDQGLRLVKREFGPRTLIEQDYEDDLPELYLPRNRLTQVITNLLVNAAHAMREVDRDVHRLRISARTDDQDLAISISDTGPGIPDEALDRIFDPFFTTKRDGQGTGLGLSISQSIVNHLGGDLSVTSVYGDGATFICLLPLPTPEQLRAVPHGALPPVPSRLDQGFRPSILLVDDDERVLRATARALRHRYKLLIARDGQEASELLASGSHADVILSELELAELDGPGFYAWLEEHRPQLCRRVIFASAAHDRPEYQAFLREKHQVVLPKPLSYEELLRTIDQLTSCPTTPSLPNGEEA